MPLIDHLLGLGPVRQALWRAWYPFLTRRLGADAIIFLNYAFADGAAPPLALQPADEPNRPCIQLYHHVAAQVDLAGQDVLEVSCGHGGGASYVTRYLRPARYTGLDLNPAGIQFCRTRHQLDGLHFQVGDAQKLPFPDASFDAVLNVEASHCYPAFPRFLTEVARVLRPGGHFLYADFRFPGGLAEWEQALASCPLQKLRQEDISAAVLRGMDLNSARYLAVIEKYLPKFLHTLGRDFAGVKGSRIYNALAAGEVSYRCYCFQKTA